MNYCTYGRQNIFHSCINIITCVAKCKITDCKTTTLLVKYVWLNFDEAKLKFNRAS